MTDSIATARRLLQAQELIDTALLENAGYTVLTGLELLARLPAEDDNRDLIEDPDDRFVIDSDGTAVGFFSTPDSFTAFDRKRGERVVSILAQETP
jgi:hypothetical protein